MWIGLDMEVSQFSVGTFKDGTSLVIFYISESNRSSVENINNFFAIDKDLVIIKIS